MKVTVKSVASEFVVFALHASILVVQTAKAAAEKLRRAIAKAEENATTE